MQTKMNFDQFFTPFFNVREKKRDCKISPHHFPKVLVIFLKSFNIYDNNIINIYY